MRKIIIIGLCCMILGSAVGFAAEQKTERITVIVGSNGGCGSHGGGFEARYQNKKINVEFGHDPNPANLVKHLLKVYDKTGVVPDWSEVLCPSYPPEPPYSISITGKKIDIEGQWKNGKTFSAYIIYLYSSPRK